jgi:hypothetical protein
LLSFDTVPWAEAIDAPGSISIDASAIDSDLPADRLIMGPSIIEKRRLSASTSIPRPAFHEFAAMRVQACASLAHFRFPERWCPLSGNVPGPGMVRHVPGRCYSDSATSQRRRSAA